MKLKVYIAKHVSYCHLLSSTDIVKRDSEARSFVLHSNKTTFMPNKVTVHYKNSRKHNLGGLLSAFIEQHTHYCFNPSATGLIFHDITDIKKTNYMHVLESLASNQMKCLKLANTRFRSFLVFAIQSTKHLQCVLKAFTKKNKPGKKSC